MFRGQLKKIIFRLGCIKEERSISLEL